VVERGRLRGGISHAWSESGLEFPAAVFSPEVGGICEHDHDARSEKGVDQSFWERVPVSELGFVTERSDSRCR
jgi:hypothetical protein